MNAPRRQLAVAVVAALTLASGAGACSRAHLTSSHGRAFHEVFAAQDANPSHRNQKSVHGLDSQEASIISGSYRRALSPQAAASPQSQQLLTTSTAAAPPPVPTTSVPGN